MLWEAAKGLQGEAGGRSMGDGVGKDVSEWEDGGGMRLQVYNGSGRNNNYDSNQYSIEFLVRTRYWLGDLIYNISCNPHNSPDKLLFLPLFYGCGNSDWEKWSNFACAAHLGKVPGIWIQVCLTPKLLL